MSEEIKRYKKLVFVDGNEGKNNNKVYIMKENSDSTFTVEWGRIGNPLTQTTYASREWDKKYREKTKKGYVDVTDLHAISKVISKGPKDFWLSPNRSKEVKEFVELLQNLAKKSIGENYTVKVEEVSKKQVERAQQLLDEFSGIDVENHSDIVSLNNKLLEFFGVIPRRMKRVSDNLLSTTETDKLKLAKRWSSILEDEQKTLDVMAGQVALQTTEDEAVNENEEITDQKDLLDMFGLEMEEVTDHSVISMIKSKMQSKSGMFRKAFKVKNTKTQKVFDEFVDKANNKLVDLLWHGSRSENWWSIFEKGLIAKFPGAINVGSMFGAGQYFATEFDKSLGYTSISGSRWSGGGQNKAYLGLYSVHLGKQHILENSDSSLNSNKMDQLGCDSTWGKKGRSLMRDEFIVYKTGQSTIQYLIEVEGSQY